VRGSKDSKDGKNEQERDGQNESTPYLSLCKHGKEGGAAANYRIPTTLHVFLYISVISLHLDCTNYTFRPREGKGKYKGKDKGKGKFHPRTGHEGPEGKYMYSSPLSLTSALDG
jgi:hypothetical protein